MGHKSLPVKDSQAKTGIRKLQVRPLDFFPQAHIRMDKRLKRQA